MILRRIRLVYRFLFYTHVKLENCENGELYVFLRPHPYNKIYISQNLGGEGGGAWVRAPPPPDPPLQWFVLSYYVYQVYILECFVNLLIIF